MSDVFLFRNASTLLKKRVEKFQKQYQNHQNTLRQIVSNFKPSKMYKLYCIEMFIRFSCHMLYIQLYIGLVKFI